LSVRESAPAPRAARASGVKRGAIRTPQRPLPETRLERVDQVLRPEELASDFDSDGEDEDEATVDLAGQRLAPPVATPMQGSRAVGRERHPIATSVAQIPPPLLKT